MARERIYATQKERMAYALGWWSWTTQDPRHGNTTSWVASQHRAFWDGHDDAMEWAPTDGGTDGE